MDRRFIVLGSGAMTLSSLAGCASFNEWSDGGSKTNTHRVISPVNTTGPVNIQKVDSAINTVGLAISILKDEMYKELRSMNEWGKSLNFDSWDYADQGNRVSRVAQSPSATFSVQPVFKNEPKQPRDNLTPADAASATGFEMAVVDAPKFFYKSGEYMLARVYNKSIMRIDPVSALYMTGVMNILSRVRVQYERVAKGIGIKIDALYTGGADGLPFRNPITWASAIGSFEGDVRLNGTSRTMRLSAGQAIRSNEKLALARAVAMSRELDRRLAEKNHAPLPAKFEIEISPKEGQLYRFAKIRFTPIQA